MGLGGSGEGACREMGGLEERLEIRGASPRPEEEATEDEALDEELELELLLLLLLLREENLELLLEDRCCGWGSVEPRMNWDQ